MSHKKHKKKIVRRTEGERTEARHTQDFYRMDQSLKGARANRFMFVRYLTAALFFVNLYWTVLLIAMPAPGVVVTAFGTVTSVIALAECMFNVSRDEDGLRVAEKLFPVLALAYIACIPLSLSVGPSFMCPFFSSAVPAALVCLFCLAIEALVMHRLSKMHRHVDKRYSWYERVSEQASDLS